MSYSRKMVHIDNNVEAFAQEPNVFLMPGLFNDTVALLLEARHYFSAVWPHYEPYLSPEERLHFTSEMSRITMRLSSVMAWLIAQKAIASGDLSEEEARDKYCLEGNELCLEVNQEAENVLPMEMRTILESTRQLYQRIYQIESQLNTYH